MLSGSAARALGYDAKLLARVTPTSARALDRLGQLWIVSCVVLAIPVGYVLWAVEHSFLRATLAAAVTAILIVNLLRVIVAGGGAAAHASEAEVRAHRPALGPTVVLSVLALLVAQPAQLPLWKGELDKAVSAQRAALIEQRATASDQPSSEMQAYTERVQRCQFVALRLQRMWRRPERTLVVTLLFWLVAVFPSLWGRWIVLRALREYELERSRAARIDIVAAYRDTAERVDGVLRRWKRSNGAQVTPPSSPFDLPTDSLSALRSGPRTALREKRPE